MKPLPRTVRPLHLKVLYNATELAECIGISRHLLNELFVSQRVFVYTLGRVTLVPLAEIRDKLEPVWDAICLAEEKRLRVLASKSVTAPTVEAPP